MSGVEARSLETDPAKGLPCRLAAAPRQGQIEASHFALERAESCPLAISTAPSSSEENTATPTPKTRRLRPRRPPRTATEAIDFEETWISASPRDRNNMMEANATGTPDGHVPQECRNAESHCLPSSMRVRSLSAPPPVPRP